MNYIRLLTFVVGVYAAVYGGVYFAEQHKQTIEVRHAESTNAYD